MSDMKIRVTTQELKNRADEVKTKTANLKAAVEATEKLIAGTSSYWLGKAGDKKRKDFTKRKEMTTDMIGRVGEYTTDLLHMAGIYEDTEKSVAELPASLAADVII